MGFMRTPPIATIEARIEPEMALKMAMDRIIAMPSPPGR